MRAVLLVLDGLGIGAMPDVGQVRPQDAAADTLRSMVRDGGPLHWPYLFALGLGHAAPAGLGLPTPAPLASVGRCRLAHGGADSYLGHQEIMGTIPQPPVLTLMAEAADRLAQALGANGHTVEQPLDGLGLLLVDGTVVVGDNLEADPGLNINLTVPTDRIDFAQALQIGRIIRETVQVARVIVFGGPGLTVADILGHVERRANGQVGVNSPALGVYDEHLLVQHLGHGVDPERQAASILAGQGLPVTLLGKMADLIVCRGAARDSIVPTGPLLAAVLEAFRSRREGLIAATVQETDLAAHEGDARRLAAVVAEADRGLGSLLPDLTAEDLLIVCADHGNDPAVNIGLHTREETPLLVYRPGKVAGSLGVRDTLADIGATLTHLFAAPPTQDGNTLLSRRE